MSFRSSSMVLALLLLAGCSTEARLARVPGSPAEPVPRGQTWSVAVTGCERPQDCAELRGALIGQLSSTGLASRVVSFTPGTVVLAVDITRGTPATALQQRFGAMAGSERIAATVTATDGRGSVPAVLRRFTAVSGAVLHPFSLEAGTQDAEARIAAEIVAGLQY